MRWYRVTLEFIKGGCTDAWAILTGKESRTFGAGVVRVAAVAGAGLRRGTDQVHPRRSWSAPDAAVLTGASDRPARPASAPPWPKSSRLVGERPESTV